MSLQVMTRILFIGETWQGSSARSLREALALIPTVVIRDIGEDAVIPNHGHIALRIANRLLRSLHKAELRRVALRAVADFRPSVVMVYKGAGIDAEVIAEIQGQGVPTVNVFPDYSPLVYGRALEEAMGQYDLVISTKPHHPHLWKLSYGYTNPCVCVPHGYDPSVHCWSAPSESESYDLALCSTWRPEYHRLLSAVAEALDKEPMSVAVAGSGWSQHRQQFPKHWHWVGPQTARSYGEFLRAARIAIAPVNQEVVVRGVQQPGDQDSTRTYELAAAHCFFLHQRTDYVVTVYDEKTEVPLWSNARELADLVRRWLPDAVGRREMARKAHARAVPAYSIPQRALTVLRHVDGLVENRKVAPRSDD